MRKSLKTISADIEPLAISQSKKFRLRGASYTQESQAELQQLISVTVDAVDRLSKAFIVFDVYVSEFPPSPAVGTYDPHASARKVPATLRGWLNELDRGVFEAQQFLLAARALTAIPEPQMQSLAGEAEEFLHALPANDHSATLNVGHIHHPRAMEYLKDFDVLHGLLNDHIESGHPLEFIEIPSGARLEDVQGLLRALHHFQSDQKPQVILHREHGQRCDLSLNFSLPADPEKRVKLEIVGPPMMEGVIQTNESVVVTCGSAASLPHVVFDYASEKGAYESKQAGAAAQAHALPERPVHVMPTSAEV